MEFPARLALTLILLISLLGCAESNAVTGQLTQISQNQGRSNHVVLGYYNIEIDSVTETASIDPVRTASGHLNAVKFLEQSPCSTCLTISNLRSIGPKLWLADIQISHPFPGLDNFTAFDVRGIVMFDGTFTFPDSGFSFPYAGSSSGGALIEPDGYTRLFNPTEYAPGSAEWPAWEYQEGKLATPEFPSAILNPYLNFSIDTPRRHLGSTAADTRTYEIKFPSDGPLRFGYAVDCCWAPPLADPPEVPEDFPLEANRPEPYELDFILINNSLWVDPDLGGGGTIEFELKVYDHQNSQLESDGGTIASILWEIPGMTSYVEIDPVYQVDGVDSTGIYTTYHFIEAPVPHIAGMHQALFSVIGTETGLLGTPESAHVIIPFLVSTGTTCWSPGALLATDHSEDPEVDLGNSHSTFVDGDGIFHLFYADVNFRAHHVKYLDEIISNEIIFPETLVWNICVVPDGAGGIHVAYSDNPHIKGGNITYRFIDPDDAESPPVILNSSPHDNQFQEDIALAPDGTMLVVWMDASILPYRKLCGAWFDGVDWSGQIDFNNCYTPRSWVNGTVEADTNSIFHVMYRADDPPNIYYFQFDHGFSSPDEAVVYGDWRSVGVRLSLDESNRIYFTFMDERYGAPHGFFMMRDPLTGTWTEPKDMVGFDHTNTRYQNLVLPDGRLTVVWTDFRDGTRGLYSKYFDPSLPETVIQGMPDDEIDAPYSAGKNQTRLCMDSSGTLHLAWTDFRVEGEYRVYYSQCTP